MKPVLSRLQYWSKQAHTDEEKLLNVGNRESGAIRKKQENDLKRAEKRRAELDGLFTRRYEDWGQDASQNTISICFLQSIRTNRHSLMNNSTD